MATLPFTLTVTNGGFESNTGTPPDDWTVDSGTWNVITSHANFSPGPQAGSNFCGQSDAFGEMYQDVDLSGVSTEIDAQEVAFELTIYMGNFDTDNDKQGATLEFLDSGSSSLTPGEMEVFGHDRAVAGQTWNQRVITVPIPPNARTARIKLQSDRSSGSGTQTWFDSISARAVAGDGLIYTDDGDVSITLFNAGFELLEMVNNSVKPAAWDDSAGTGAIEHNVGHLANVSARTGNKAVTGKNGDGSAYSARQKHNLLAIGLPAASIDAGSVAIIFKGWSTANDDAGDRTRLGLAFYESDGTTQVGSDDLSAWATAGTAGTYTERTHTVTVPADARVVEFILEGDNNGGGSNATGTWDDASATISNADGDPGLVSDLGALPLMSRLPWLAQ